MHGMSILGSGEPNSMYHWETEQEDFLVLAGEALLIVEGQERRLRQWDFVHCPDEETQHGNVACARFPPSQLTRYRTGCSQRKPAEPPPTAPSSFRAIPTSSTSSTSSRPTKSSGFRV
jgi:glyoxylate utilization-related uncharacterized protein